MALAPNLALLGVPSSRSKVASMSAWLKGDIPRRAGPISRWTEATAFKTPRPPKRLASPSLRSTASWLPVLAPEGTMARPKEPSDRSTSASTVGLPRESRTSLAWTRCMSVNA